MRGMGQRRSGGPTSWAKCAAVGKAYRQRKAERRDNWFKQRAREMREHPTSLESKLELVLDSLNLNHKKQWIVGNFIVDFYLPAYNAVIEADGPRHETYNQRRLDARRDRILVNEHKVKILHLRMHEFFSADGMKHRIMEFLTGVTTPAQEGFKAIDDCGGIANQSPSLGSKDSA